MQLTFNTKMSYLWRFLSFLLIFGILISCGDDEPQDMNNSSITADFSVALSHVTLGESVQLTDMSSGTPTSWDWVLSGATPSTSAEQNPLVVYNQIGEFDVSLTVSDGESTNSITKTGAVNAACFLTEQTWDTSPITYTLNADNRLDSYLDLAAQKREYDYDDEGLLTTLRFFLSSGDIYFGGLNNYSLFNLIKFGHIP